MSIFLLFLPGCILSEVSIIIWTFLISLPLEAKKEGNNVIFNFTYFWHPLGHIKFGKFSNFTNSSYCI